MLIFLFLLVENMDHVFLIQLPRRELLLSLFLFYVSFALQVWFQFPYLVFYFLRWCFCSLKPLQKLTMLSLLNGIFPLPLVPCSPSFNFLTSFFCWHLSYFPKLLSLQIFWLCCCLKIIFQASASVKLVSWLFHCYYFWYECSKGIFVLLEIPVSSKIGACQAKRKMCWGMQFKEILEVAVILNSFLKIQHWGCFNVHQLVYLLILVLDLKFDVKNRRR